MGKSTKLAGILALCLMAGVIGGCSNANEASQEEVQRDMPVEVDLVSFGSLSGSNQLSGVVEAFEDVDVSPKVAGEIVEIFIKKGDAVNAGQVIARMDDYAERNAVEQERTRLKQAQSGLQKAQLGKSTAEKNYAQAQASLRQAEASLADAREGIAQNLDSIEYKVNTAKLAWEEAQKNLERMKELHGEGLISDQEYENAVNGEERAHIAYNEVVLGKEQAGSQSGIASAEAAVDQARIGASIAQSSISEADLGIGDARVAVEQAQLAVDAAQERLDDKKIVAPVSGEVVSMDAHVGEAASPQAPFVKILELNRVKLNVNVTAPELSLFSVGQSVEVEINRMEEKLSGTISYISATSQDSGLFTVEVELGNSDRKLRPGMFGSIVVEETLAEEGIIIPTKSIVEKQGESYVFIIEDGIAVRKIVEITRFDTDFTAVTGDLKENDQIVVKGQNLLEDGNPVQIMKED